MIYIIVISTNYALQAKQISLFPMKLTKFKKKLQQSLASIIYAKPFQKIHHMTKRLGYKQKFEDKMLLYLCPSNPLNLDEDKPAF